MKPMKSGCTACPHLARTVAPNLARHLGAVLPIVLMLLALFAALTPDGASAHAAFDRSDPQPNTVLAQSPTDIRIWFTEPLEDGYNEVRLFDKTGHEIPNLTDRKSDV